MNVNFQSTTNIIQIFKEDLIKSKGTIICISSICGVETILGAPVTYSVSKSALNAYVNSISRPFDKNGVRINAITTGNILIESSTSSDKIKSNPSSVNKMLKRKLFQISNPQIFPL